MQFIPIRNNLGKMFTIALKFFRLNPILQVRFCNSLYCETFTGYKDVVRSGAKDGSLTNTNQCFTILLSNDDLVRLISCFRFQFKEVNAHFWPK